VTSATLTLYPKYYDTDNSISLSDSITETIYLEDTSNSSAYSRTATDPIESRFWVTSPTVTWEAPSSGWTSSSGRFPITVTNLVQAAVSRSAWKSGNVMGFRFVPDAIDGDGRVATKTPELSITFNEPCSKKRAGDEETVVEEEKPARVRKTQKGGVHVEKTHRAYLGDYFPPSVKHPGAYLPQPGQFCNEKVEEQKKHIWTKYAKAPKKQKIYLMAVSECIIEEVERYVTEEYIETMHMQKYRKYFVPPCKNVTELP